MKTEEKGISVFKSKPRNILNPGDEATFNGTKIKFEKDKSYSLSQSKKLDELQQVSTVEEFKSVRAKIPYIGVMPRPDICSSVQLLASGTLRGNFLTSQ